MAVHTKDLDTLTAWAEELGWVLIDTDPPVLTKFGRTLQLKFNGAGKINGMTWIGGPEHGNMMSGACSFNRVRLWMETPLEPPPPDDDLP
jgi:hypothetical protein